MRILSFLTLTFAGLLAGCGGRGPAPSSDDAATPEESEKARKAEVVVPIEGTELVALPAERLSEVLRRRRDRGGLAPAPVSRAAPRWIPEPRPPQDRLRLVE